MTIFFFVHCLIMYEYLLKESMSSFVKKEMLNNFCLTVKSKSRLLKSENLISNNSITEYKYTQENEEMKQKNLNYS